ETRDVSVPDLTSAQAALGTPQVFRARNARELQQLRSDPDAVPVAVREFSRTDRPFIRVPAYGPGETVPTVTARLLNRGGQPMSDLQVAPASTPNGAAQIDLALAGLAPGEYVVEIAAAGEGAGAKELVGIRVTG